MLMKYGDTSSIQDPQWCRLELRSERTLGPTLKRLGKHILTNFEDNPVEVFIPVQRRDHENFELLSDCYIFIHSDAQDKVRSLRGVVGVANLLVDDRTRKPMKVDDSYVQEIIQEARERHEAAILTIQIGSFVRILDGESRDYCGHILDIDDNLAHVKIILKGRVLLVETPVGNLMSLDHVPEEHRVYYYCDVVENFLAEDPSNLELVMVDLTEDSPTHKTVVFPLRKAKKHRSRHETVTAFVRRAIESHRQEDGILVPSSIDMVQLMHDTLDAIASDDIKKPKTAHIIYSIVKRNMVDDVYASDPTIKTFRDVIRRSKSLFKLELIEEEAKKRGIVFPGDLICRTK